MSKRTLITSALPYANGYLHLGHSAGALLPADIMARYRRLIGEEVLFICGSDEHGVAITIAAEKEKVNPKDIIDKYHFANKESLERLNISFDNYGRTSNEEHHKLAKEFFLDFLKKGYLTEKEEEQLFDEDAQMFLPDRYVEGTCPNCGNESARGDQCDNCGNYYNQSELINPISLISKKKPILKSTTHWYFKFGEFQEFLEEYTAKNQSTWKDNVIQQTKSWLKAGLADRAITRDISWGVSLEGIEGLDKELVNGKVLYVWFEAVLGYISSTMEYCNKIGKPLEWRRWWQSEETEYLAFLGKDNIVFHTIIFPSMLKARRDDENPYILPTNVPANEFLNLEGQKLSKSRNWSIDLRDYYDDFPNPMSVDVLRYALTSILPETKDSDFTWKDYQARNNNELAAILGNFINRTLTFTIKNFDGKVPSFEGIEIFKSEWENKLKSKTTNRLTANETLLIETIKSSVNSLKNNYDIFRIKDALTSTMDIARAANKYFNDEEPWKAIKEDKNKAAKTMYICINLCRILATTFIPFIPYTSKKIGEFLNSEIKESELGKDLIASSLLLNGEGIALSSPEILFSRIEDNVIEEQIGKLGVKELARDTNNIILEEPTNLISIDEFFATQLKTAKIIHVEKMPKSKKLLKLQVEIGNIKRQILSGIAEFYTPEELIGEVVVVVFNLKPAKLMGELSEGMLLAANTNDGKVKVVTLGKDFPSGMEVR